MHHCISIRGCVCPSIRSLVHNAFSQMTAWRILCLVFGLVLKARGIHLKSFVFTWLFPTAFVGILNSLIILDSVFECVYFVGCYCHNLSLFLIVEIYPLILLITVCIFYQLEPRMRSRCLMLLNCQVRI